MGSSLHRLSKLFEKLAADNNELGRLFNYVKGLAHSKPTDEQFNSWLRTNQTVLNAVSGYKWMHDTRNNELFGHLPNDTYYQDPQIIISPHPVATSEGMSARSSGILRAVPPIPNLHITRIEIEQQDLEYPKEIMHHEWVIEGLEDTLKNEGKHYTMDEIVSFIRFNDDTLNKLRKYFTHQPKLLGAGSDGAAYLIGKDRVLKIFRDRSAYDAAKEAMKRIWNNPELAQLGEAMIYDVGAFAVPLADKQMYYSITENLPAARRIGDTQGGVVQELDAILPYVQEEMVNHRRALERLKANIKHPRAPAYIKLIAAKIAKNAKREFETAARRYNVPDYFAEVAEKMGGALVGDWFEKLVEEIVYKYTTGRVDLHPDNLGFQPQTGRFIYFDPTYKADQVKPNNLIYI